jgi:hypothetical protein
MRVTGVGLLMLLGSSVCVGAPEEVGPCPSVLFTPNLAATETFDPPAGDSGAPDLGDQPCEAGATYADDAPSGRWLVVGCNSNWCASGYHGHYCVDLDTFGAWRAEFCGDCQVSCRDGSTEAYTCELGCL